MRAFGDKVFDVIEASPDRLREVDGIGRSVHEVRMELEGRGISMDLVQKIMHQPHEVIDHEGVEMVDAEG